MMRLGSTRTTTAPKTGVCHASRTLRQTSGKGPVTHRDVKNEGRSGDVYENTGEFDKMSGYCSSFLQKIPGFCENKRHSIRIVGRKCTGYAEIRGESATKPSRCHAGLGINASELKLAIVHRYLPPPCLDRFGESVLGWLFSLIRISGVGDSVLAGPTEAMLKQTALNAVHRAAGARMVDFCGWDMPVEYSGITREHLAVRTAAGLFDVSHMGEIEVYGAPACSLLQFVTSNNVSRLVDNQAQYSALMMPNGAAIDDCIVHRFSEDHYFICVNAANTDRDYDWITKHNSFGAGVRNVSAHYSQVALQGPRAVEIMAKVTAPAPGDLKYYWFRAARCCGVEGMLARTGYTGEDGFEFYFPPDQSVEVWNGLLEAGKTEGLIPVGLGARNTLRLEAAYPLYGHELDEETTLLEANLGWITRLEKGDFLGRQALLRQRERGVSKKLVGFEMTDRPIARDGYPVWVDGGAVGKVTSGSPAPFLKKNIGLAYVPSSSTEVGREIDIEIRGKLAPARIVSLPFYKRPKLGN